MVKTPKMRHSKSRREPVTIELEPGAVSRIVDEDMVEAQSGETKTDEAKTDEAQIGEGPVGEAKTEEAANASWPEGPEEPVHAEQTDIEPWEHAEQALLDGTREPAGSGAEHTEDPQSTYPSGMEAPANSEAPVNSEAPGISEAPVNSRAPGTSGAQADRAFDYGFDDASAKIGGTGADRSGETPKTAQPRDKDMATQPKRSGINSIAAGIIGGVIALAGAGGLQFAGLLGAPGSGAGGASLDGVNGEFASLKTEIAALRQAGGNADASARVDGLSSALDQVKADVAALKSAAGQSAAGDKAGLTALGDRVKQIETAVAGLEKTGNTAPVDLAPLNEKLAGLEALMKSAGETATAQEGRIAALEQSVSQLSSKVDAQAAQPKIALAIAASALKAALDRGAPFTAELETFAAMFPDAPEIATLRAYAEKGVPTRAEIAAEVDTAANAMVAAATPVDQNAGFLQSLMSSAKALVKVRPIGAVEGAGVPEIVARMEAAVNQGDYAKALSEYATLPDAANTAGADFAGKLKARMEVEKQIDALIAGAMKA